MPEGTEIVETGDDEDDGRVRRVELEGRRRYSAEIECLVLLLWKELCENNNAGFQMVS